MMKELMRYFNGIREEGEDLGKEALLVYSIAKEPKYSPKQVFVKQMELGYRIEDTYSPTAMKSYDVITTSALAIRNREEKKHLTYFEALKELCELGAQDVAISINAGGQ